MNKYRKGLHRTTKNSKGPQRSITKTRKHLQLQENCHNNNHKGPQRTAKDHNKDQKGLSVIRKPPKTLFFSAAFRCTRFLQPCTTVSAARRSATLSNFLFCVTVRSAHGRRWLSNIWTVQDGQVAISRCFAAFQQRLHWTTRREHARRTADTEALTAAPSQQLWQVLPSVNWLGLCSLIRGLTCLAETWQCLNSL